MSLALDASADAALVGAYNTKAKGHARLRELAREWAWLTCLGEKAAAREVSRCMAALRDRYGPAPARPAGIRVKGKDDDGQRDGSI